MSIKLAFIPAAILAAGISLAACGTSPAPVATHTATRAPSAATTSPVGTWNVAYSSAPTHILGQESITQPAAGSTFVITTKTAILLPVGHCSVPANIQEGTFTGGGPYTGTLKVWNEAPTTCTYAYPSTFTATLSSDGNTFAEQIANANPPLFTLTRTGSTPAATPPVHTTATAPAAPTAQSAPAGALPTVSGVTNSPSNPQVRPSTILLFADGSFALGKITWSSWTATSASGSGTLYVSNGNPSMATGAKVAIQPG